MGTESMAGSDLMAGKKKKNCQRTIHQTFAPTMMRLVRVGDVNPFARYIHGIDKKVISSRNRDVNAMLFVAAKLNREDIVEFIIEELGEDMNSVSDTGRSLDNVACISRLGETLKYLIKQGVDIHRPDELGRTCLMKSVYSEGLCQLLIDAGALLDTQDNLGNTALHHAVRKGDRETVQFLLDQGSNPTTKNKQGDDALQLVSLQGMNEIVEELVARQELTTLRWFESLQLLGCYFFFTSKAANRDERALIYWRRSVTFRLMNPSAELRKFEPMPACIISKEVNTVEELEELCQDEEMVHMYALENRLRILGPGHSKTTDGFVVVSKFFAGNREYRRSFDLLKYAFQFLQERTPTWTEKHYRVLDMLCEACSAMFRETQIPIEFNDVFEILDMVTSKMQFDVTAAHWLGYSSITSFMKLVLSFILFVVRLIKSPDQMDRFKEPIRRLVHSRLRNDDSKTFLHCAVEQHLCYPVIAQVLMECGADVNSVDSRQNTAMHLCMKASMRREFQYRNEKNEVIKLLLQYSAHPDIVNDDGEFAANGLSLNMLDHVSLKCLATAVIRDRRIPYVGRIPKSLESFVEMHGKSARDKMFLKTSHCQCQP